MYPEPDLATIAALIGDPTRAAILSALLGGQALPATELADRAHITPQTTSAHLAKLVEGGLLGVTQTGRHRYYRLKNADVARALEALAVIAPPPQVVSRYQPSDSQALRFARTCYDHLAGKLGVAITQSLLEKRFLTLDDQTYHVTEQGTAWFAAWNIDPQHLHKGRRAFARTCLDWSERRDHLAGALGAALATAFFERGWIERLPDTRAVQLTETGRAGLLKELQIEVSHRG